MVQCAMQTDERGPLCLKKRKWGKILSIGFILLSMLIVVLIAFNNPELMNAWDVIIEMDKRWIVIGLLLMIGYVVAEGTGLYAFLRMEGYKVKLSTASHFSFAGIYYANVTPGSSGGQPMQIYLMSQRQIPAGVATSALLARAFFNQVVEVALAVILWLCNWNFVAEHLSGVIPVIILGCLVNFFCVPAILLISFHRNWVESIVRWGIRFLTKHHICKKPEEWQASSDRTIEYFHSSLMDLVHHPLHLLIQTLVSIVEMLCLMAVPLLVYYAMGLSGTAWYQTLTVAFLLFVSANYTPLPGASGAQEGGFLLYFRDIFTGGTVSVALLVWRFITYYLYLIVGCADSILTSLRVRKKPILHVPKRREREKKEQEVQE